MTNPYTARIWSWLIPYKTKMILEAEEAGCKAIGGKGMLQQQGAVNYELFVGKKMPLEEYNKFQAEQAK